MTHLQSMINNTILYTGKWMPIHDSEIVVTVNTYDTLLSLHLAPSTYVEM